MKSELKTALYKLTTIDPSVGMTSGQQLILDTVDELISENMVDDIIEGLPEDLDTVVDILVDGDDDHEAYTSDKIEEIVSVMEHWW